MPLSSGGEKRRGTRYDRTAFVESRATHRGRVFVSRTAEQKAGIVFDEFTAEYTSGKSPDIASYVARCPLLEREKIGEALAGYVFTYENYFASQLSEDLVRSAMDRLQRVRQRKQKLHKAQSRARLENWNQVVTQPLMQLASLLYPDMNAGGAQVAVMNRAVPDFASGTGQRLNAYVRKAAEEIACLGAERLLSRAGVGSFPVPLPALAEQLSVLVQEASLENLEGCLVTDGDTGGILLNSDCPSRRRRFTLAHELGHYVLHRTQQHRFADQEKELFSFSSRVEVEASAFASYLLMPPQLLPQAFGREVPSLALAEDVSERFDVSLMAVLKRLVRESNYLTVFICSSGNRVQWPEFSPEVQGYNHVVSELPKASAAYALFRDEAEDVYTRTSPAEIWFDRGQFSDMGLYVVEESRRFATGHIYTLINVRYDGA